MKIKENLQSNGNRKKQVSKKAKEKGTIHSCALRSGERCG